MKPQRIVVREYARLTTSHVAQPTLDCAQVSARAFDWLCELAGRFRASGAALLQLEGRQWLKLDNYVGVLESPCGQVIEILPKHHSDADCEVAARQLLCKLIASALELPTRSTTEASLSLYQTSLAEWVMRQFLLALEHLLKRGLRFDYQRIEEEQRYLRGQLDVVKQMRQPLGRQHFFQIRHDVYLPDRAENRLLQSALQLVCQSTQDSDNWRLAHELAGMLHELPASRDVARDFQLWRNDRLLAHYQPLKPWCELILYRQMPLAVAGQYRGISLLFPMERLFESYVAQQLRRALPAGATLRTQVQSHSLCTHAGSDFFQLRPDLLLALADETLILDTKWKLLDAANRSGNYGLSQADFYQLYAYGQKYLKGRGRLVLIYPAWLKFNQATPIARFQYDTQLSLHVLPFDLDNDQAGSTLLSQLCDASFGETTLA